MRSIQHLARSVAILATCLSAATVFAREKVELIYSDTLPETDVRSSTIRQEAELVGFFKADGSNVYAPDKEAFRSHVPQEYKNSKFSADWTEELLEKIDTF